MSEVRERVRERYREAALEVSDRDGECGCGPGCCGGEVSGSFGAEL